MPANDRVVLVTGATGHQGGAVARHLLKVNWRVRAMTRDPNKPAARELAGKGAEVVKGDFDDRASLNAALQGAYGVFSVQNPWEAGVEAEVRQGKAIADAAKDAGVKHFIYSSVGSAHRNTGIPHFDSKWKIEQHVRAIGLPWTIFRPVYFMENWKDYQGDAILTGKLMQPLDPGRPLQQIAVDDIGVFMRKAFDEPDRWLNRELDLAGDDLAMPQVVDIFSRALGRKVEYVQVPWDAFRDATSEEMTIMYRWFNDVGYEADIPALRREHPGLKTLEKFVREQPWLKQAQTAR